MAAHTTEEHRAAHLLSYARSICSSYFTRQPSYYSFHFKTLDKRIERMKDSLMNPGLLELRLVTNSSPIYFSNSGALII